MVTAFDNFSLELRRAGGSQLVYKHAISTIAPARAPDGFVAPPAETEGRDGLQDLFLTGAAQSARPMSLYLVNGVMLEGKVAAYDQYCVLLARSGVPQMIYKHAISTLQPSVPDEALAEPSIEEASA